MLELEAHHGIDLGLAYSTPDSAKTFIGYMAKSQRQSFINNFSSFLVDGNTDDGNKEDKPAVIVYCTRNTDKEEFATCTRYASVHSPEKANAANLFKCVSDAMRIVG